VRIKLLYNDFMNKKSFIIFITLLLAVPLQLGYLYLSKDSQVNQGNVAGIKTVTNSIVNSLFIGDFRFTLFGYTSPSALVNLVGQGIADETYADTTGYFEFSNRFLPLSPHEACLSARDQFGRTSAPTCLPPFPTQNDVVIGPVIIPPTMSLDKPNYYIGDEVKLTGQSLPEAEISLSMFTRPSSILGLSPIKTVEAFSLPKLNTQSDDKGNFSLSLPSEQAQNYRIFTQVDYQDEPSANSSTLSLRILPVWWVIVKFFSWLWHLLKARLLEVVILLEILALIAHFLRIFINPYYLVRKRALALYKSLLPEVEENLLPMVEDKILPVKTEGHPLMVNN